jgi:iron-sulfur cluster assembly accessory protein
MHGEGGGCCGEGGCGSEAMELPEIKDGPFSVEVTSNAVSKVKAILTQERKENFGLRIKIIPGGCSGFMYDFLMEDTATPEDHTFEKDGLKIFIDKISAEFMRGSVVDYVESLQGAGFKVENPNFTKSCGCGKSVG